MNKKLKVGDTVVIKSEVWYNNQKKNVDEKFVCGNIYFLPSMREFCGKKAKVVATLMGLYKGLYLLDVDNCRYRWSTEMLEESSEELDLIKILKDCPRGTKLYSTVYGEVLFKEIIKWVNPVIRCSKPEYSMLLFDRSGRSFGSASLGGECILFPAKNQRDWSEFKIETSLQHRDLVWCWDNNDTFSRVLKFYDKKNTCTYSWAGHPRGYEYHNYEKYEGEWPEWAKEAVKLLEDSED